MASLSVRLPLTKSDLDGYTMIKGFKKLISQNLKMLCLTVPGERVMDADFGAGIPTFLFQNYSEQVHGQIDSAIREQAARYLPVITIDNIATSMSPDSNALAITLTYRIPQLGVKDLLQFTI